MSYQVSQKIQHRCPTEMITVIINIINNLDTDLL